LRQKVKNLHLVVRGEGLEASMSQYLIERIGMLPNVELHTHTEVVALEGNEASGLTGATFRDRRTGDAKTCPLRHLFLFIGADPNAKRLEDRVQVDDTASW
jgi:thioredoxin reductase (NADPH)